MDFGTPSLSVFYLFTNSDGRRLAHRIAADVISATVDSVATPAALLKSVVLEEAATGRR